MIGFDSYIGSAKATWSGSTPTIGGEYDVEINVECHVTWGMEIKPSESDEPKFWLQDDVCYAQGGFRILFADDDYTATNYYIRLGYWMLNLYDVSDAPTEEQPCTIAIPHRRVWLYPTYT
ncbi:MAG: hypothetical protein H7Y38_16410 [Armatimonadetes bacterium]|nr:hypothetical protein [Armatimonadota bacterium]